MILTMGVPQEKDWILTIGFIIKFRCLVQKDYWILTIEFNIKTLIIIFSTTDEWYQSLSSLFLVVRSLHNFKGSSLWLVHFVLCTYVSHCLNGKLSMGNFCKRIMKIFCQPLSSSLKNLSMAVFLDSLPLLFGWLEDAPCKIGHQHDCWGNWRLIYAHYWGIQ